MNYEINVIDKILNLSEMFKYIRYYNHSIALGASSTLRFRDNRGQELVKTLEAILGVRVGDILELRVLEGR